MQPGPVNIHEILERVRSLLHAEFPGVISVKRDYDTSLPDLVGDRPSWARCRERPLLGCQVGDDGIECLLLRDEIVEHFVDVHRTPFDRTGAVPI